MKEKLRLILIDLLPNGTTYHRQVQIRKHLNRLKTLEYRSEKDFFSHIPSRYGTERNEQIHRIFNRSLIFGATRITFHLTFVLLVCLFYHHSKKIASNLKHKCNSRIQHVPPITNFCDKSEFPIDWHPYKSHSSKTSTEGNEND